MRVVHIVQRDDPATGGAARVAVELVRRLPDCGVNASCLFVYGPPGRFSDELPARCDHLGLSSARDVPRLGRRLIDALRRKRPDIVHHHDGLSWTHVVTKLAFRGLRYGHAHLDPAPAGAPWRHRVASLVHRSTYDRLVCISDSTRRAWIEAGFAPERAILIPNGVDETVFVPPTDAQRREARAALGLPPAAPVVGFVGRLHNAMKGTDDFVRALAALPPDHWGIVAGSGQDASDLHALAAGLGVSDRIVFTGALDSAQPVYQAIDALLVTSHYEPFGLVALEAAASGVPVVGFAARGGLTELLGRIGGTVLPTRDPAAMASAARHVIGLNATSRDKDRRRDTVVETYAWSRAAQTLAADYRVIGMSGRHSRRPGP